MTSKANLKPIYTTDYYKMEKLIQNKKFQNKLEVLLSSYKAIGSPIPKSGVKNLDGQMEWINNFWKKYYERKKTGLNEQELPQLWGYWIDDILTEFKLDPKNSKYSDFLESYIFFGKKHLNESFFETRWIRNQETDKMELFIQIYPHTKREHISAFWDEIVKDQKYLPEYIGKSKKWENFDRDLEIYTIYQKIKSERPSKRALLSGHSLDFTIWGELTTKYPNLRLGDVRKAISRIEKLETKPA
jgi:hypothetical protein